MSSTIVFDFLALSGAERRVAFEKAAFFFAAVAKDGDTSEAIERFKREYMTIKKEEKVVPIPAPTTTTPPKVEPVDMPDQKQTDLRITKEIGQIFERMKKKLLEYPFDNTKATTVPFAFVQDLANDLRDFAFIFNQTDKLKNNQLVRKQKIFWADDNHVKETFNAQTDAGGIETIAGANAKVPPEVAANGYPIRKAKVNYYVDRLLREYATHMYLVYVSFTLMQNQVWNQFGSFEQLRNELLTQSGDFVAAATQRTKYRKFLVNVSTEPQEAPPLKEALDEEFISNETWPELTMPEKKGQVFNV